MGRGGARPPVCCDQMAVWTQRQGGRAAQCLAFPLLLCSQQAGRGPMCKCTVERERLDVLEGPSMDGHRASDRLLRELTEAPGGWNGTDRKISSSP